MDDEHRARRHVRWIAGLAVVAVGVAAAYVRMTRPEHGNDRGERPDGVSDAEFADMQSGRGEPAGGPSRASVQAGYELHDTRVRTLVIVMIVSVLIMAGSTAGVFLMYAGFDRHFTAANAAMTVEQTRTILPPLPRLQADPYRDIDAVVMEQERRLDTYGYGGPDHTDGHIPIERAMQQVVGRPLDASAQTDAAGAPGSAATMPTTPAFPAARTQGAPANAVQGEGRPGAIAPRYDAADDRKVEDEKARKVQNESKTQDDKTKGESK